MYTYKGMTYWSNQDVIDFVKKAQSEPKLSMDGYIPEKSTWYNSEYDHHTGRPGVMDTSKLFHLWSQGTARGCQTVVTWRAKDMSRALAILDFLSISYSESDLSPGSLKEWKSEMTIRTLIKHDDAWRLDKYGDCVREWLNN